MFKTRLILTSTTCLITEIDKREWQVKSAALCPSLYLDTYESHPGLQTPSHSRAKSVVKAELNCREWPSVLRSRFRPSHPFHWAAHIHCPFGNRAPSSPFTCLMSLLYSFITVVNFVWKKSYWYKNGDWTNASIRKCHVHCRSSNG